MNMQLGTAFRVSASPAGDLATVKQYTYTSRQPCCFGPGYVRVVWSHSWHMRTSPLSSRPQCPCLISSPHPIPLKLVVKQMRVSDSQNGSVREGGVTGGVPWFHYESPLFNLRGKKGGGLCPRLGKHEGRGTERVGRF